MEKTNAVMTDGYASVAGFLDVYHYDPSSMAYTGKSNEYISLAVSVPANSTDVAPGPDKPLQAHIFHKQSGKWEYVADHRGEIIYSTGTGAGVEVTTVGEYPAGTTPVQPSTPFDAWNGSAWVTDEDARIAAGISHAEQRRTLLISNANAYMSERQWPGKAAIGRLKGNELAQYNLWLDYLDALVAVDTTGVPDIEWPTAPAA